MTAVTKGTGEAGHPEGLEELERMEAPETLEDLANPTDAMIRRLGYTDETWNQQLRMLWRALTHRINQSRNTMSYRELVTLAVELEGAGTPMLLGNPGQFAALQEMLVSLSLRSHVTHGVLVGCLARAGEEINPPWHMVKLAVRLGEISPEDAADPEQRMVWYFEELKNLGRQRFRLRAAQFSPGLV